MVPIERRRLLKGAVVALAGLAGCSGESSTRSATVGRSRKDAADRVVPDHHSLRHQNVKPPVWLVPEDATPTATASDTEHRRYRGRSLVSDASTAERLRFADVDGADEARTFVSETNFGEETLLVHGQSVPACYNLSLCDVSWTDSSVRTSYGQVLRDADDACDADARHGLSMLIRLPVVIEEDDIRSSGSSTSGSPCYERSEYDREQTDEPAYGPATGSPTEQNDTVETDTPTTTQNTTATTTPTATNTEADQ